MTVSDVQIAEILKVVAKARGVALRKGAAGRVSKRYRRSVRALKLRAQHEECLIRAIEEEVCD